ncbi:MAG: hypothetical protein AW07_02990 [Candidatus Accumulibacter sp. SK-11]|nr:MAG: hypothetical protein AW07_02990 [Candidatus Accumulibacter sp. SK-11]
MPTIACIAAINWPTSSLLSALILTDRSPSASALAAPTASLIGRVIERVTQKAKPTPMRRAAIASTATMTFAWSADLPAASPLFFIRSTWNSINASVARM